MTEAYSPSPGFALGVTGADRRTLDVLFSRPVRHDLAWAAVVSLFEKLGSVEEGSNNAYLFTVDNKELHMNKPHTHHLTAPEILGLRRILEDAGLSPGSPRLKAPKA